jgi:hypothetical protein
MRFNFLIALRRLQYYQVEPYKDIHGPDLEFKVFTILCIRIVHFGKRIHLTLGSV